MKTMRPMIGLALLAVGVVGQAKLVQAQDAGHAGPAEAERAERAIETLVTSYIEAWNTHDMDGWAVLFTEGSDFVNRRGGWWRSRDVNVEEHAGIHEMLAGQGTVMDMEAHLEAVDLIAPRVALAHVRTAWSGMATPTDRDGPPEAIMAWVVVDTAGGWRIRAVQNTLVDRGPGPR